MNLNESRFEYLQEFICGDNKLTPSLSGPDLLELFYHLGFEEKYDSKEDGLPGRGKNNLKVARRTYVLDKLTEINDSQRMDNLLEIVFNQDHFNRDPMKNIVEAVSQVNSLIQQDSYSLVVNGDGQYRVVFLT